MLQKQSNSCFIPWRKVFKLNKSSDSNWYFRRCRLAMQTFYCSWKNSLLVLLSHLHPSNAAHQLPVSTQVIAGFHDTEIHMESEIIHVLHCTFSYHIIINYASNTSGLLLESTNSAVKRWWCTKNQCGIWNIALIIMGTICIEGARL